MNRTSVFNSPFLLGFDQFERTIDRISKLSSDSYPPYNIEQTSPNSIRITIAVAGFNKKDLDISLEGNQLQIRGSRDDNETDRIYIHRGIATRQFQRNFIFWEHFGISAWVRCVSPIFPWREWASVFLFFSTTSMSRRLAGSQ